MKTSWPRKIVTRIGKRDTSPAAATCPLCDRMLIKGEPRGKFSILCLRCRTIIEVEVIEAPTPAAVERAPVLRR